MRDTGAISHLDTDEGATSSVQSVREHLVNSTLVGLACVGVLAVLVNLWRGQTTGWQSTYIFQDAMAALVGTTALLRSRMSHSTKVGILLMALTITGISGIYRLGLAAASIHWLFISGFLGVLLFPTRLGICAVAITPIMLSIAGIAFTNGWVKPAIDLNQYAVQPSSWGVLVLATSSAAVMVALAAATYIRSLNALLHETAVQRDQLRNHRNALEHALQDVTTFRAETQALRSAHQTLAAIQQSAGIGLWQWEPHTDHMYWSQSLYDIFGIQPKIVESIPIGFAGVMSGIECNLLIHPEDRQAFTANAMANFQGRGLPQCKYRFTRLDGVVGTIQVYMHLETDERGVPKFLNGVVQDITERELAEHALVESEARVSIMLRMIPEFFAVTRLDDGCFIAVNDGTQKLSGWTRDELIGKSSIDLGVWGNPSDRDRFTEMVKASGSVSDAEFDFHKKDGSVFRGLISARVFTVDGSSHLALSIRDVTQVRQQEAALRASEALHRAMFQSIPEYMTLSRVSDGQIVEVNRGFEQTTGWTRSEALGRTSVELGILNTQDRERITAELKSRHGVVLDLDLDICRKDGSVWNGNGSGAIFEVDGVQYLLGICRDVTQTRKQSKELVRLNEQLISHNNKLEAVVAERTSQLVAKNKELETLSVTDRLTGLVNRRRLDEVLSQELARCERLSGQFSVILLDVDKFKSVNDEFGHQVGDKVLVEVSRVLKQNTRPYDVVGRWGGEEFLIVCNESHPDSALTVAEKLRNALENHDIELTGPKTGSFGVASYCSGDTVDAVIARADAALYRAKQSGRNRVVSAGGCQNFCV